MDKLKLYAAPLVALVLFLLWFLVVRPMMADDPPPAEQDREQVVTEKEPLSCSRVPRKNQRPRGRAGGGGPETGPPGSGGGTGYGPAIKTSELTVPSAWSTQ